MAKPRRQRALLHKGSVSLSCWRLMQVREERAVVAAACNEIRECLMGSALILELSCGKQLRHKESLFTAEHVLLCLLDVGAHAVQPGISRETLKATELALDAEEVWACNTQSVLLNKV